MVSRKKGREISDEDAAVMRDLFERYVTPNMGLVFKVCSNYTDDPKDVEDNFQEVLINLYKYIRTYNPERPIQAWLHIVTKHCVYQLNLKEKRLGMLQGRLDDLGEGFGTLIDESSLGENVFSVDNYKEFYTDNVLKAIDKLEQPYKSAILLQQAGFKLKEIADIEYKSGNIKKNNVDTIKSRLFLARQKLKEEIDRYGNKKTD